MRLENYITEGINDRGIWKACFVMGAAGAGKTFVSKKVKSGSIEPRVVNTDKFFPFFKKQWKDEWKSISGKVKTINNNQLTNYINSMLPLAIDSTAGNTSSVLKRIGILEYFGYDIAGLFINTSLENSLERAAKRERPVNPEFIKYIHNEVNKAKNFYRGKFQTWIEVDNDDGMLTDKVVLNAFKFMSKYYNSPIQNPVGKDYKEKMIENGWKYLSPNILTIEEIKKAVDSWYKV